MVIADLNRYPGFPKPLGFGIHHNDDDGRVSRKPQEASDCFRFPTSVTGGQS